MGFRVDLTGQKFNRLTVLYPTGRQSKHGKNAIWMCKCDCGNYTEADSGSLKCGTKKSCGCLVKDRMSKLNYKHGGRNERLYLVWMDMRRRCYNTKDQCYKNYGGRGITVCDEWQQYEAFREWAQNTGYDDSAKSHVCTLDRIDVNGDYCPSNCRWVDAKTQCNNKRNNLIVTYNGETHTATEWDRICGFPKNTMNKRIHAGWTPEKAITSPMDYTHQPRMREGA